MVLDENTRQTLEEIIDKMIAKIPEFVERVHRAKAVLNVKDESDFIFGWIWGEINAAISVYYALNFEREVTQQEMNEVFEIINRRAQEMRTAIDKQ
jgi:hypothetical protein